MLYNNVFKKVKDHKKSKNSIEFDELTLGELLSENFISNSTVFSNFDQMIDSSGIRKTNNSFVDMFISQEWNEFVNRTTKFNGWKEMIEGAVKNHISSE